jgi:hypothetical protein
MKDVDESEEKRATKRGDEGGPTTWLLSLALPIKTVAMFTPDERQRVFARRKLTLWDRGMGSGSIFELPVVGMGNLYELPCHRGSTSEI